MQPCQEIPTPQLPALTIPTAVALKQHITSLRFPWHPFLKGQLDQQQTARMPFPPHSVSAGEGTKQMQHLRETELQALYSPPANKQHHGQAGQGWHQPSTEIKSERMQFSPSPVLPSAVSLTPPV